MNTEIKFERKKTQDNFATERIDVIHNSLLGTYSNDGTYIITGKILNELLLLNKYVSYQFGNSIYCSAYIKDLKQVDFEIVFSENKKLGVMTAELFLLESVSKVNGYYSNTIKTIIANFEDKSNNNFVDIAKKFYNVLGTVVDDGKVLDESVFSDRNELTGIVTKIELNDILLDSLKSVHEKDFETIFKSKLKALKQKNNIFGEKVLAEFNSEYSKIERHFFVDEKGKVKYKGLNELLDKCVEMISGTDFSFATGEQQYRELIDKENNLRAQNTLQNEANVMMAIANKSLNDPNTNMQNLLKDMSATSGKMLYVIKSSGGDSPHPISRLETEESFIRSKEQKTFMYQDLDSSANPTPRKEDGLDKSHSESLAKVRSEGTYNQKSTESIIRTNKSVAEKSERTINVKGEGSSGQERVNEQPIKPKENEPIPLPKVFEGVVESIIPNFDSEASKENKNEPKIKMEDINFDNINPDKNEKEATSKVEEFDFDFEDLLDDSASKSFNKNSEQEKESGRQL